MADQNHKRTGSSTNKRSDEASKKRRVSAPAFTLKNATRRSRTRGAEHAALATLAGDDIRDDDVTDSIQGRDYYPDPELDLRGANNPQKTYHLRSSTVASRYAARESRPSDSLGIQDSLDALGDRIARVESCIDSLRNNPEQSNVSTRIPATEHPLRRKLGNLSILERQTNELEIRMHDVSRTVRDLQAKVHHVGLTHPVPTEPKHPRESTTEAQAYIRKPEDRNYEKEDGTDDVIFVGEKALHSCSVNHHDDRSGRINSRYDECHHHRPQVQRSQPQPKAVTRRDFVAYLKRLDFLTPYGMEVFAKTPIAVKDYTLCTLDDGTVYFVRLGTNENGRWTTDDEVYNRMPLVLPRRKRGQFNDDEHMDAMRSPSVLHYRGAVCEIKRRAPELFTGRSLQYALPLGEIYIYKPRTDGAPPDIFSTNFFLLMDVATPKKSLWIVFAYEHPVDEGCNSTPKNSSSHGDRDRIYSGGDTNGRANLKTYALNPNSPLYAGLRRFDMACIADSLGGFVEPSKKEKAMAGEFREFRERRESYPQLDPVKVRDSLYSSACLAHAVFMSPNLDDLVSAINRGWK